MPSCTRSEDLLATLFETAEDAILTLALDGKIQDWSRGAEHLYGYTAAEVVGVPLARLLPLYEFAALENLLGGAAGGKLPPLETTERLHKNGSKVCVMVRRGVIRNCRGEITGILEIGHRLGLSSQSPNGDTPGETQLRMLVEQMPVVLWTTDRHLRITSNWGSGPGLSKIRPGALVGRTVYEFLKCQDPQATLMARHFEALQGLSSHFEYKQKNRVLDIHLEPLRGASGDIPGCIGVGLDITQRNKSYEQMLYQATHDALTGLANYREFMDTLEREVRRADRSQHSFAVLLLDLDELKRINDRLGHLAGNRALKRLAAVMKQHCRSTDLAARFGGDEFAWLVVDAEPGRAEQIAARIERCVRNDGMKPAISVSVGTAMYPEDGRTPQELLDAADRELYRRKRDLASRSMTAS
jgi:diguanylate cyclase (GGDEF)-like protein/PAS domain S-box-containing protein